MRSIIAIEVEHGEDTDALSDILWTLGLTGNIGGMPNGVREYVVRVDVPAAMVLDLDIPSVEAFHKMNASTYNPKG